MKTSIVAGLFSYFAICSGLCQGQFWFLVAGTRLYSLEGLSAGSDIWGQMLIGYTPDDLSPVGVPLRHNGGVIDGGVVTVPGYPCESDVYMQMLAWDDRLWGASLENVPTDQLGKTDIVPIILACFPLPVAAPFFQQPAIVPIPEPSCLALGTLIGTGLVLHRLLQRRSSASVATGCNWSGADALEAGQMTGGVQRLWSELQLLG